MGPKPKKKAEGKPIRGSIYEMVQSTTNHPEPG